MRKHLLPAFKSIEGNAVKRLIRRVVCGVGQGAVMVGFDLMGPVLLAFGE